MKTTINKTTKDKLKLEPISIENTNNSFFSKIHWLLIFILLFVTFFTYQSALDNEFVDWDDSVYVLENNLVRDENISTSEIFKQAISLNYHPITILTMRWNNNTCLECKDGISAKPFIKWNIFLHLINTFLVILLTFKWSKNNFFVAIFSGLVFALHPMHVESVAWVSERKDVLYVFFFLLGLLSYTKFLEHKIAKKPALKWLIFTFLLFVLSCLSKAMAVVFPLVLMLLDFWYNKEEKPLLALKHLFTWGKIKRYILFFTVALIFGVIATKIQKGEEIGNLIQNGSGEKAINDFATFTLLQRFQFAAYGFCMYLFNFFLPLNLCTFYPYPTQLEYESSALFWTCLLICLSIIAYGIYSLKKSKLIAFGLGFYLFTVILVLQFISVGLVILADRYSYLPYIGISFTIGMLLEKLLDKKAKYYLYTLTIICAIWWINQTSKQIETWQNSETLWNRAISLYPNEEKTHSIRGNYFGKMASLSMQKGDTISQKNYFVKAEKDFVKAVQLNSQNTDVYIGLGNIYAMQNLPKKAIEMYSKAINFNANSSNVYFNRGIAFFMSGNYQKSILDMNKCLEFEEKQEYYLYRGISNQQLGATSKAKFDFEAVLKINPNNVDAQERIKLIQ